MTRTFTASITREGDWYIAHCLEVDVASQGETADAALANLREAIELHFEPPIPTVTPEARSFQIAVDAA
jgi:predicted RNase H-like HicB family nuclease